MLGPQMHVGDARNLDALGLADESVDCIITSPPYWHLKQYADDDEREIGHQQTMDDYRDAVGTVFEQCYRLAKPTGVMWLVIDTLRDPVRRGGSGEVIPLPFDLAQVARAAGWRMHDVVVWQKNKTLPYSGEGKLRNLIEYVVFLTKSTEFKHRPYRCADRHRPGAEWLAGWPERYHPLGRRPANIWEFDIDTQGMWDHSAGMHACPFPQDLVARFIDLTTDKGDVVLDPFAGIGTVPAQAAAMGRRGFGVELNPDNAQIFEQRVLPEFQASWEASAEFRRLAREDQLSEALTILRLRLLKAGKELMRVLDRLSTSRTSGHPASEIESVLVPEPPDLIEAIHIDDGRVDRPSVKLHLIGDLTPKAEQALLEELSPLMTSPPFSTFGLDVSLCVSSWGALPRRGVPHNTVQEFAQSRHGAYTAALADERLFTVRPRLLTTVRLEGAVDGSATSPLEDARLAAERRVLESELASGADISMIAGRLSLPRAELHLLLLKHKLVDPPKSFAISLPTADQLSFPAP